jgi:hypothetical protein
MAYPGSQNEFGQLGCVFLDEFSAITPPTGRVFVAITFLEETTLDSSGGLVAEDSDIFFSTEAAAHSEATATGKEGTGGKQVDVDNTFPKGITIYGRWTEIDIASGSIIAYIGA